MESLITKLKSLYLQFDKLEAAGDDVVAELRKEIINLELAYLKEEVFPQLASYLGAKIKDLRCGLDGSFQFDGKTRIDYSFCTSEVMLLVKNSIGIEENGNFDLEIDSCFDIENDTKITPVESMPIHKMKAGYDLELAQDNLDNIDIRIVDYSERAIAVYGNTKAYAEKFKGIGGYYNDHLKDGPGWVFSKRRRDEVYRVISNNSNLDQNSGRGSKQIVHSHEHISPIDNHVNPNEREENITLPSSQEEWIERLSKMRGRTNNGYPSPHKSIFILTIIEGIKQGLVTSPIIYPMVRLSDLFKKVWNEYVPSDWPYSANFYQPFMHMSGENFYTLEKAVGVANFDINQNWTKYAVNKYVRYGKFDETLFYLFFNDDFTTKLKSVLLKIFSSSDVTIESEGNVISGYSHDGENHLLRKDLEINKRFGLSSLDFKRFLLSIKNPVGDCYQIRMVDQLVASLESTYIFKMVLKYQKRGSLYDIKEPSIIKCILSDVKKDFGISNHNEVYVSAIELYVRFFNLVCAQQKSKEEIGRKRKKVPFQLPCGAKVKWIRSKDFSISGDCNSSNLLYNFIIAVDVERVYAMKIPFLKGYLVDKNRNLKYLSSCKYLDGGYWLNAAGSLAKKLEQIQLIADNLNIEIEIEISN